MQPELLNLAKKYEKQRNWKKAVECYNHYIEESGNSCEGSVYVSHARCLRLAGHTNLARESLLKGRKLHPNSERILLELHNLYDFLGDWVSGKNAAQSLIHLNPKQADYHFRLGRSYSFLMHYKKAKKAFKEGLQYKHGRPLNEVMREIQLSFSENPEEVRSKYIFIDGKNNLGAFIHEYKGRKYFTKISHYTTKNIGAGREETFYKHLCADFTQLKETSPDYIDSRVIDNISYLTLEAIESAYNGPQFKRVIELSQKITAVSYRQVHEKYPIPDYVYQFKRGRAISVVHFFTQIHDKAFNEKLFESLYLIIKQNKYPEAAKQIIHRLQSAIMDNQLYSLIEPEKHYSLLHGDFAYQNVLLRKENKRPVAIDWTSYTIGPHFIDIARYVTSLLLPYAQVEKEYLENEQSGRKLSLIERIFFLYALILFYFQKVGRKGVETEVSVYILPALEELERLVMEHKTSEGDHVAEEREYNLKIKQLEQRLAIIEEERRYMHKRLENVLNSKSWKITAPLRFFTEGRRKKL
jgi:tetratricopeptide (TPR) repeat protein